MINKFENNEVKNIHMNFFNFCNLNFVPVNVFGKDNKLE